MNSDADLMRGETASSTVVCRTHWIHSLRFRISLVVVVAAAATFALRKPLLEGVAASILVVDQPRAGSRMLLILDGDRRFDVAARECLAQGASVFIIRSPAGRLERLGILPSAEKVARRELEERNVPAERLVLLSVEPIERRQIPGRACRWLSEHPGQELDVLCDRFSTRTWRLLFDRAADPALRERVHLVALRNRDYDETNWWQSSVGLRSFLNGCIALAFHLSHPNHEPVGGECTDGDFVAAFERSR